MKEIMGVLAKKFEEELGDKGARVIRDDVPPLDLEKGVWTVGVPVLDLGKVIKTTYD